MLTLPFVSVVDSEQRSRESRYFAEADQQAFVDLALRVDIQSAEEEYHSNDSQNGSCEELYVCVHFHKRFEIRCKSSTKKRSHQESDFAKYKNLIFFSIVGQIVPAILRKMFGF